MTADTQIPKDCPAWLAQWIGKSDERLHNIEQCLVRLVKRSTSSGGHSSEKPTESNKVTFKWLIEKLLVPAMFMAAGYLLRG